MPDANPSQPSLGRREPADSSLGPHRPDRFSTVDDLDAAPAPDLPVEELLEALWADQRRGWPRGAGVPARVYLERYPAIAENPDHAADLIFHEFLVRDELGTAPPFDDYLRDYPEYAALLRDLHAVDPAVRRQLPTVVGVDRIGGYELLEEIGRGGMGVVYKARQVGLNRIVAVKMILTGQLASDAEVQRFRREAQMAADLQHPNIVAVHEVGEKDGQHFFSMDYVEGTSLAALDRDHLLSADTAARYAAALAGAVHYAHERGVLHRDLKPGNVLIDKAGNLRITDFGLARRITGDARLTVSGQIVGTPSYMPPEQASGRTDAVGPASDIYALGATLYDLLTGRPPFQAQTPFDTMKLVVENDPVAPRLLNPLVPRDLETICLKCLEKEPGKRYPTAQALAEDLECFLAGKPIRARPVGWLGRTWRWCRRNPQPAALSAALALVVVGGLLALTGLWQHAEGQRHLAEQNERSAQTNATQAENERGRADRERDQARSERDRARRHLQLAEKAVNEFQMRIAMSRELRELGLHDLRKRFLNQSITFWRELIQQQSNDPASRGELAVTFTQLATLHRHLGQYPETEAALRHAVLALQVLTEAHPEETQGRFQLAHAWNNLGRLYRDLGRHEEARTACEHGLVIRESLTRSPGMEARYQADLAQSSVNLAYLYMLSGRSHHAEHLYRHGLELARRVTAAEPQSIKNKFLLGAALDGMGFWHARTRQFDQAEKAFQESIHLMAAGTASEPGNMEYLADLAAGYYNLGSLYFDMQRLEQARKEYEQSCTLHERLVQLTPEVPYFQMRLAIAQRDLAGVLLIQGAAEEAEKLYQQALSRMQPLIQADPRASYYRYQLAHVYHSMGVLSRTQKQQEQARDRFEQAIHLLAGLVRDYPSEPNYKPELIRSQEYLAATWYSLGVEEFHNRQRMQEAENAYRQSAALWEQVGRERPDVADHRHHLARSWGGLAMVYQKGGRSPEAMAVYLKVAPLQETLARNHPKEARYWYALAVTCGQLGDLTRSAGELPAALAWLDKSVGALEAALRVEPTHGLANQFLPDMLHTRAELLTELGRAADAVLDLLKRALLLARRGEHARAAAETETVIQKPGQTGATFVAGARIYAQAVSAVPKDKKLSDQQRKALTEQYGAQAVTLLRQAHAAGYFKDPVRIAELKHDADLAALGTREDFQKLLQELQTGAQAK